MLRYCCNLFEKVENLIVIKSLRKKERLSNCWFKNMVSKVSHTKESEKLIHIDMGKIYIW